VSVHPLPKPRAQPETSPRTRTPRPAEPAPARPGGAADALARALDTAPGDAGRRRTPGQGAASRTNARTNARTTSSDNGDTPGTAAPRPRRRTAQNTAEARPSQQTLFRREAAENMLPKQYGEIVLNPGGSSRWVALCSLALLLALVALLAGGSYTRRSTVSGQLVPSDGLIRLTTPQAGVVLERHAQENQQVTRGQLLFVLSGERLGPGMNEVQRDLAAQIGLRQASLQDDLRRLAEAEQREQAQLRSRLAGLAEERSRIDSQLQLQGGRVAAAQDALARYRGLFDQGYVSRDELALRETDLNEQRNRLESQRREALALQREAASTLREADSQRDRSAAQRTELDRARALLQQELTETESRRRIVVTAPADGRLSLVRADIGQTVEPLAALAQLVPSGTQLQARLLAPSRAAGFTRPGGSVLLRYDAYPYQKFGQHAGQVISVSGVGMAGTELPAQLPGSSSESAAPEPVFAITVRLPAQALQAEGRALPLQAGMKVEAELLHETRRLYEWALEPLLAMRARSATPNPTTTPSPMPAIPAAPASPDPAPATAPATAPAQ